MPLTVVTGPAFEALHLDEVKNHVRVDSDVTDDDARLQALIVDAREWLEASIWKPPIHTTFDLKLDCFPAEIWLPRGPVSSVTSIIYIDGAGDSQTLASSKYQTDLAGEPARIMPAHGLTWPSTRTDTFNAVTVRFVAGFGADWNSVPQPVRQAMLFRIEAIYDGKEALHAVARTFAMPYRLQGLG